jgi:hypothetical protein
MSTTNTPDQSERANGAITDALFASPGVTTHATARLIAASVHGGTGTALERLAATGRFDPVVLRREVEALSVGPAREEWRLALIRYLDSVQRRTHPWTRTTSRRREPSDEPPRVG